MVKRSGKMLKAIFGADKQFCPFFPYTFNPLNARLFCTRRESVVKQIFVEQPHLCHKIFS